jgi:hypothetical protein
LLVGYPLAAIYRTFIYNKSATVQHLYFITAGIALYLFNCGLSCDQLQALQYLVLCLRLPNISQHTQLGIGVHYLQQFLAFEAFGCLGACVLLGKCCRHE